MTMQSLLLHLIPLAAAFAYFASGLRLLCFQRKGARCRRGVALLAAMLIGALFCAGLEILLYQRPVSPWQTTVAVLLCILVYRSRGNLAALLRPSA
jgi:uncharacterized membrane protein YfcA